MKRRHRRYILNGLAGKKEMQKNPLRNLSKKVSLLGKDPI